MQQLSQMALYPDGDSRLRSPSISRDGGSPPKVGRTEQTTKIDLLAACIAYAQVGDISTDLA
jgi:hypothetical protein